MKNFLLAAVVVSVGLVSCKKTETKVETTHDLDGTETTTTIESEDALALDTAKINEKMNDAQVKLDEAERKIDEAADKGKHQLKKAGEDIKHAAEKGAASVEKGARNVKEDLQKK